MPNLSAHWWTRIVSQFRNSNWQSRRYRGISRCSLSQCFSVEQMEERVLLSAGGALPSGTAIQISGVNDSGSSDPDKYFYIENRTTSQGNEGTIVTGTTYFTANDGVNGKELWRINSLGDESPVMVEDSIPGGGLDNRASSSSPHELTNVNGTLFFTATDSTFVMRLWRINNSTGMAEIVPGTLLDTGNFPAADHQLTNVGDTLYFQGDSQLWRVRPGQNAERVGAGVVDQPTGLLTNLFSPAFLKNLDGTLYFRADQYINGTFSSLASRRLWRTTNGGGVELVSVAYRFDANSPNYEPTLGSFSGLTVANDVIYFDSDGPNGLRLWRVSNSGPASILPNSRPSNGGLTNVNGTLYFISSDSTNGTELWKINNDSAGTALIVEDAIPGGGIGPGSSNSYVRDLTNVNGTLFFSADSGPDGLELWMVNSAGTAVLVEDASPGRGINNLFEQSSSPRSLTNVNGTLYFTANDGISGEELWKVNSADNSVAQIVDDSIPGGGIYPGSGGSYPRALTNVNGTLYFSAHEPTNGQELWRVRPSDKAELVEDYLPGGGITLGSAGSHPRYVTNVNGTLFFTAFNDVDGFQPWKVAADNLAPVPQQDPITITVRMGFPLSYQFASDTFMDPEDDSFTLSASDISGNSLPFSPYLLSFQSGPTSGEGTLTGTPESRNLLLQPYPFDITQYLQLSATDTSGHVGVATIIVRFEAPPQRPAPSTVYVDPAFHLTSPVDPDGTGPAIELGYDAFDDVQTAIEAVADGGTVVIRGGEYSSFQPIETSFGRFKPLTISIGNGILGEGVARVVLHTGLNLHPRVSLRMDLAGNGSIAGVNFDQLVVDQRIDLGRSNLVLGGSLIRQQGINYELIMSNSILDQFNSSNSENAIAFNNRTLKVHYLTANQPNTVNLSYYVPASPTGFLVNGGQAQRSIIFGIDVTFASSLGLNEVLELGRIKLAHYDVNGNPIASEQDVVLSPSFVTISGSTLQFNFSSGNLAISNNNSKVGDGYYRLKFDLDGSRAFVTEKTFFRLWGDFNGDKKVDPVTDGTARSVLINSNAVSPSQKVALSSNSQKASLASKKERKLNGDWTIDN